MSNGNFAAPLAEAATLTANLVGHSAKAGLAILSALQGAPSKVFCDVVQGRKSLAAFGGCDSCDIPAPCWEPQSLGEVASFAAPGGQATLRFRITNSTFAARICHFNAVGAPVTFSSNPLTLGPMERRVVEATMQVDPAAKTGSEQEAVLLIRACRNYYVRWTVKVMDCGANMCNEIEIDDRPDQIHHWYDHFYCHRTCQEQRK